MAIPEEILDAKILIIDDQHPNVLLLDRMLKVAGYRSVKGLTDSREVADVYREFRPDLVLLDLRMPHLDGFQVMDQLKEIEKESYLSILVLTAQSDRDTRVRALESGAKDFLGKPLDQVEVLSRIRNMLEIRLMHNQLRDHNKILEDKVRARTKALRDSQLEIVRRLSNASEHRDYETGEHIVRMSRCCERIAAACGCSDEQRELILNASPMHDVGKIGIPDRILLKPAKLDPDEWDIMKKHTVIGGELLAGGTSELIRMAETIAVTHHERWDGTGYPNKLRDEEIPLEGRICALADVFDALTSPRPYKKAWPVEKAVDEIRNNKGTQFDPDLTDAFLEILPDLLTIREEHPEPDVPEES